MTDMKQLNAADMLHIIMRELSEDSVHLMLLMDLIYLCDWRCALVHDRQLTDITWQNYYKGPRWQNHFQPLQPPHEVRNYSAVPQCVVDDPLIRLDMIIDPFGDPKPAVTHYDLDRIDMALGITDERILDVLRFVFKIEADSARLDIADIARSTYPVMTTEVDQPLDLVTKAADYRQRFGDDIDTFVNHYR